MLLLLLLYKGILELKKIKIKVFTNQMIRVGVSGRARGWIGPQQL